MRRAVIFLSFALAGCSTRAGPTGTHLSQPSLAELSERVDRLETEYRTSNPSADLKLGDRGYSTIRTDYGAITIQWEAAVPSGTGSKLTFKIGNPLADRLSGIELYGHAVGQDGLDIPSSVSPWRLKGNALSGAWSKLTTIIEDVPPKKIVNLRIVGAKVGGIGLTTP